MHGISSTLLSTNTNTSSTALSLTSPGQHSSSLLNNNNSNNNNTINNNSNCSSNNNNTINNVNSSNLISLLTTVQQFETIRKWLLKHHKKYCESDQPSNKALSHFLCQYIQFQEENLGREAAKLHKPGLTRLPFEVLVDFGQGGALCHLFALVFKYKYEQKM